MQVAAAQRREEAAHHPQLRVVRSLLRKEEAPTGTVPRPARMASPGTGGPRGQAKPGLPVRGGLSGGAARGCPIVLGV